MQRYWNERGAQVYDLTHRVGMRGLKRLLAEHLNVDRRGVVLDFGTGTGIVAQALLELGFNRVVGVDVSEHMLRLAKRNLAKHPVKLVQADGHHLPLADGSVDAVVSRWALWVLPNPRRAVEEMVRVLRPGGVVVAIESDPRDWRTPPLWRKLSWFPIRHLYLAYLELLLARGGGLTTRQFLKEVEEGLPLFSIDEYVRIFKEEGLEGVETASEDVPESLRERILFSGFRYVLIKGTKPGRLEREGEAPDWDAAFHAILACPVCRLPLSLRGGGGYECRGCGRGYPVVDGIPSLLPPRDMLA